MNSPTCKCVNIQLHSIKLDFSQISPNANRRKNYIHKVRVSKLYRYSVCTTGDNNNINCTVPRVLYYRVR